jgi:signal peptidase II
VTGMRRWLLLFGLVAAVLLLDQGSKQWIVDHLVPGQTVSPIPALVPFFQLTFSYNTGAAFGFLPNAGDVFLILAVIVVLSMIYFYPRIPAEAWLSAVGIALVCGGAIGNAIDRVRYEAVVDFIHYQIPGVVSNVSNLADHAIVVGVFLMLVDSWIQERREKAARGKQESQTPEG